MKLFIDTAKLHEIESAMKLGIVDGITTNPSKIHDCCQGANIDKHIGAICKLARRAPVSLEVKGGTSEEMYTQARKLLRRFNKNRNVVIKIPINPTYDVSKSLDAEGLKVIRRLADEKVSVNATLIFTPEQALLAAKAGAKYVSPFVGRVNDLLRNHAKIKFDKSDYYPMSGIEKRNELIEDNGIVSGIDLVAQIVQIFKNFDIKTEVIAASVRNAREVREAALAGAHVVTIPTMLLKDMLQHPLTLDGMLKFNKAMLPSYEVLMR